MVAKSSFRKLNCCAASGTRQREQAKALARQMIDSFVGTDVDAVIINAAGCGHTLKEYGHILEDDAEYQEKAKNLLVR